MGSHLNHPRIERLAVLLVERVSNSAALFLLDILMTYEVILEACYDLDEISSYLALVKNMLDI